MKQRIALLLRNFSSLAGARMGARLLHFVLIAVLARKLGPTGVGGYVTANALAVYFLVLSDLGISSRLVREGAIAPGRLAVEVRQAFRAKVVSLIGALIIAYVIFSVIPYEKWIGQLFLVLAIGAIVQSYAQLFDGILRAVDRMENEAIGSFAQAFTFVVGSTIVVLSGANPVWIGCCKLVGVGVHCLVSYRAARAVTTIKWQWSPAIFSLRRSSPYAATTASNLAFAQLDLVLLPLVVSQDIVGHYGAISRLLIVFGALATLASTTILPTATRIYSAYGLARFSQLIQKLLVSVAVVGSFTTVMLVATGGAILNAAFGPSFAEFRTAFAVGALYVTFKSVNALLGSSMTAAGRERLRAVSVGVGLGATAVLVLTLSPWLGVMGAALALVTSELVLTCSLLIAGRDIFIHRNARSLFWISAAVVAGVTAHLFADVNFGNDVAAACGLLIYALIIGGSGVAFQSVRWIQRILLPSSVVESELSGEREVDE